MKIQSRIWIQKENKSFLGNGRIELLKLIESEGSISKAAKKMRMSYKAAWDNLNQIKDLSGETLIQSSNGGIGGGGTSLTCEGQKAIAVFEHLQKVGSEFFSLFDGCQSLDELDIRLQKVQKLIENFNQNPH